MDFFILHIDAFFPPLKSTCGFILHGTVINGDVFPKRMHINEDDCSRKKKNLVKNTTRLILATVTVCCKYIENKMIDFLVAVSDSSREASFYENATREDV